MGYASKLGRARVSSRNPQAAAACDRCGFIYNHIDLKWQFDWAGASLINKRILVCRHCYDTPQNQLRAIVIPADPTPIMNPRTVNYEAAEIDTRFTSGQNTIDPITGIPIPGGDTRITQDDQVRVTQQVGPLEGVNPTFSNATPISITSIVADGTFTILVNAPDHGLSTGNIVGIEGLTTIAAMGAFTVTVTGTNTFTYVTNIPVSAGTLNTATTRVTPMAVGLPYGFVELPKSGT
jgi:hypothetical protein